MPVSLLVTLPVVTTVPVVVITSGLAVNTVLVGTTTMVIVAELQTVVEILHNVYVTVVVPVYGGFGVNVNCPVAGFITNVPVPVAAEPLVNGGFKVEAAPPSFDPAFPLTVVPCVVVVKSFTANGALPT